MFLPFPRPRGLAWDSLMNLSIIQNDEKTSSIPGLGVRLFKPNPKSSLNDR